MTIFLTKKQKAVADALKNNRVGLKLLTEEEKTMFAEICKQGRRSKEFVLGIRLDEESVWATYNFYPNGGVDTNEGGRAFLAVPTNAIYFILPSVNILEAPDKVERPAAKSLGEAMEAAAAATKQEHLKRKSSQTARIP